jgi:hypothetical protein
MDVSIYMWWFPVEILQIFEQLFASMPVKNDIGGLLGLIVSAGIGFSNKENSYFENEVIHRLFISPDLKKVLNLLYESQQNLLGLLV